MGNLLTKKFLSLYEEHDSILCGRTLDLLDDWRIDRFVYSHHEENEYGGYLVDALIGAEGTLGVEVTAVLSAMLPECEKNKGKRSIFITDHPNLNQMPDFMVLGKNGWKVKTSATYVTVRGKAYQDDDMIAAFEDERYLIILRRVAWQKDILMDIYKK